MGKTLNVLIVEDSEDDHDLVIHALQSGGFDVTAKRVATAETLLTAFEEATWDAVISDYSMPGFDGMGALELVKKSGRDLPFIVVSGRSDIIRTMMKAGAHDYVNKSELSKLAPVLEHELGEAEQRRLRKLAEVRLSDTQQHLDQALDASNMGAFNWNLVTGTTWRSARYDQIFACTDTGKDLDIDTFIGRVVPDDRVRVHALISDVVRTGHFELECGIVRFDNVPTSVVMRGRIVYDDYGKATCIVGTIADVTEQNRLEEKMHQQDELIRQILDSTAEAIFGVNLEGICTLANPACARMLGYGSPEEMMGQHIHSLIHHHHADGTVYPEVESRVNQTFRTGEGTRVTDEVFWRADGTKFETEYTSAPLRRQGEIIGAVVTFVDVSERRELESRLRQAQKMEAIGQLAGGVAHDFNNILAVILMQAGLVETLDDLPLEVRDAVDGISNAAERAANLTRQLLLFSRRQEMLMRDCDLNEIVRNLTRMLERIINENIRIQFKWSNRELCVNADPGMIDQILMNLVVNARDAMPRGGQITVETSAKELDELMAAQMSHGRTGSYACLSVTDTGCGIPRENLARIFEPFFTTKEADKGTGLGLSTVFGIVQQHLGWIHVDTSIGVGTTFYVFLPRLDQNAVAGAAAEPEAPSLKGTETILLVEDDLAVSSAVQSILEQLGYTVLSAASGQEALEVWETHHAEIELVLTDLVMPDDMRGEELAVRLRQDKPDLKIVYTSGYSKEAAQGDCALQEGVNFLQKPYSPQKLSEILRKNLD